MSKYVDIVFDGPPGPVSGRFVEVEDDQGRGIAIGEWIERDSGMWALRIQLPGLEEIDKVSDALQVAAKRADVAKIVKQFADR